MQAGDREGRFSPTHQHQWTLLKSRRYPMTVAVTIVGKVDTAETGVGGDSERSTVAPLRKINLLFPHVVIRRKLK